MDPAPSSRHLRWRSRPALHDTVLLCAFEGWNDAGDAASTAAAYLRDRWSSTAFADLDPEEFYDFTTTRPDVELDEGDIRRIVWPSNEFSAVRVPGSSRDLVVLVGVEPQLRWRTFCEQVLAVAEACDVGLVVTLGALLAEVPHTRPVSVIGAGYEPDVVERLSLRRSTYEGPTGIVGVLHDAFRKTGVASASLWAAVPTYVPGAPSPKATLALVEKVCGLLDTSIATTELEIASAAYERQVTEVVDADEDTADYLRRLEEAYDESDGDPVELPTGDELAAELERFLREHGD